MLENNDEQLLTAADAKSMVLWSDDKRNDFVALFKQRTTRAKSILAEIAAAITDSALRRRYISNKHVYTISNNRSGYYYRGNNDIREIAAERAEETLKNLPPLKDALKVIDKDTASKMEELDKLKAEIVKLQQELTDLSEPIDLADMDQTVTIGAFRAEVKKLEKKKAEMALKLRTLSEESYSLEGTINKRLYSGIPGLSTLIVKIVNEYYDRVKGLDTLERRVEEKVKFGDSEEAMDILQHFEKDEVKVSSAVQEELKAAVAAFQLPKKLKAKKNGK